MGSSHNVNYLSTPPSSAADVVARINKKRPLKAGDVGAPRKRTTRACDQCNQLRTKCDGQNPCHHCTESKLECGYLRVPLKRGKASQTYIESAREKKAAAAAAAVVATTATATDDVAEIRVVTDTNSTAHLPMTSLSSPMSTPLAPLDPLDPLMTTAVDKSRSLSANPDYRMDTPDLMFDQAMTPNTGWLLNLVSSSLETPQRPRPDDTPYLSRDHNFMQTQTQTQPQPQPQPPTHTQLQPQPHKECLTSTRFPVLNSIAHLLSPLPMTLAEHLLESFFAYSTHSLAHLIRRVSMLSTVRPRQSSPALIFSCLLVAAHHTDTPLITGTPGRRETVIQRFTQLTIEHLKDAAHQVTPTVTLDDVIAYIHLGTVVSASEFKGSSLRFWATAWALSKELKLPVEVLDMSEEDREERRRTWWLLYIVDRHLGLCYNRPLAMLDSECGSLYQPMDDSIWLSDELDLTPAELDPRRIKGLCHYVSGQGLFGYFLPLMTILGSLLELHHFQQNPILPLADFGRSIKAAILSQLEQYTTSLKNWNPHPCAHIYQNAWRDYAFQISHVLHILALIPWDPLELNNSPDSLISSPQFKEATVHAISASKHTRRILTVDSDLMLMPFFLGIYLLQSSFVLLFIVDRVEHEASRDVISACETIVHAHEVCVVTLNTEYQRNFRRVMRGTMSLLASAQLQHQQQNESSTDSQSLSPPIISQQALDDQNRREKEKARKRRTDVLGLYRWTSGGHGLAV